MSRAGLPLANPAPVGHFWDYTMRVLVIEDDAQVANLVAEAMRDEGHEADCCARGDDGLVILGTHRHDALVLDLMLPGVDGWEVLRRLRATGRRLPVLVLTARDAIEDRVEGLDLGADDYLPKPFAASELRARMRSILRRHATEPTHLFAVADLRMNTITREVRRSDHRLDLTTREFALLECLLRAEGRPVTRTELLKQVWNLQYEPGTNVVDVAVQRLRRKIDDGHAPALLQTVRGLGYAISITP